MRIVDSPGVVFDEEDEVDGKGGKRGSVLLRNVVKVEDVEDPIAVGKFVHSGFLYTLLTLDRMQWRKFWLERLQNPFRRYITYQRSRRP